MTHTPHHPAVAAFVAEIAAQPDMASTTPGPACPECHGKFIVTFGRRSKRWIVLHSGENRDCERYRQWLPRNAKTQEEALAIAQEAAK